MRQQIKFFGLLAMAMVSGALVASPASAQRAPCAQIRAACREAGFVQGAARAGNGLLIDCVQPIIQGQDRPEQRTRPLPNVDPHLVAACKARNPNFGQRNAGRTAATEQPAPVNPPPAVATAPAAGAQSPATSPRPNIVFVLTDDLAWNLVQYMPHVLQMQKDGVTFSRYFVTDSLCCPSRSSIFTGRYPHNTGVYRNVGADGGYLAFYNRGHEQATFAAALAAVDGRTAMLGKYLNGYQPARHPPAPGWKFWAVAGNGYPEFNYSLNQDGQVVPYGNKPVDYLTDVLSGFASEFIKRSAGSPFLIEVATFAPHAPYTPAPRDAEAFPGLHAPRTPAYDAAPDPNAPQWLKGRLPLSAADMAGIDRDFRKRAQSVLAVDAMIGELQAAVAAIHEENNTYFVFSSDNGYHMGEYRLMPGKMTAFDTDIRVPLIVTGPGVPAGLTIDEITENIDLAPTFTELAGMVPAATIDGRSLVPFLHSQQVADWRQVALIEHRGPVRNVADPDLPGPRSGNPPTYEAIRGPMFLYVEYADGTREYHDLASDPDELRNTFGSLSSDRKAQLHATLVAIQACQGVQSCSTAEASNRSAAQR
jgi:arylsulfatase A-like enzyme